MKKLFVGVAVAALSIGSAIAADLPSHKAPPPAYIPPPPSFSWTGVYAGLNIGGAWLDTYAPNSPAGGGVLGGGQIGYNYQLNPMFVVGLEADIQGTSVGGNAGNNPWSAHSRSVDWFGTARGRLGLTLFNPRLLVFGTGGFAYGDLTLHNGWAGAQRQLATGWTAGGGVEYAVLPNWSVKAEYIFTNIGANYPATFVTPSAEQRVHMHTIRAGVNYKFNWGGAAPVMAGY